MDKITNKEAIIDLEDYMNGEFDRLPTVTLCKCIEALKKDEQKKVLLDAISITVDCNGYQQFIKDLNDIAHTDAHDEYGQPLNIFPEDVFDSIIYADVYIAQIQVIWIMLVNEFGDYHTSPRTGWIRKSEEFKKFISELLERVEK